MAVIIDDKFYKSVPLEAKTRVAERINKLVAELDKNNNLIKKLSKGFYCRKIKNLDNRYKFRIDNGDRIIFCRENKHKDIRLLRYCNHDSQILAAGRISPTIHIVAQDYTSDDFDNYIDTSYIEDYKQMLLEEDLIGAYNLLVKETTPHTNKAKLLRRIVDVTKIKDLYDRQQSHQESSGIVFRSSGKPIREEDFARTFNRIYDKECILFMPLMNLSFPANSFFDTGFHFLDMPFFASDANKVSDPVKYNKALAAELYKKVGMIPRDMNISLEAFFYRPTSKNESRLINKAFEVNIKNNTISNLDFVTQCFERHDGRTNAYIRTLSILKPEKAKTFNCHYLFG